MPDIRPFCNTDPPAVVSVWQRCAAQAGLALPVSVDLFERLVFSKLYFPQGRLFLAFDGETPIGLAHAAFGPNDEHSWISPESGIVCMLLVCPEWPDRPGLAADLLAACERFLIGQGATTIQGGAAPGCAPFYAGLYGGSFPPGVFECDEVACTAFEASGYQRAGRMLAHQRSLEDFRPIVDRQMIQLRRATELKTIIDPASRNRWEAMTIGEFDLTRFELATRRPAATVASLTVRDMGPPAPHLPGPAAGVLDLFVDEAHRRQGMATFLLSESLKQLMQQGIGSVQVHVSDDSPAGMALCRKLGLEPSGTAVRFLRTVAT